MVIIIGSPKPVIVFRASETHCGPAKIDFGWPDWPAREKVKNDPWTLSFGLYIDCFIWLLYMDSFFWVQCGLFLLGSIYMVSIYLWGTKIFFQKMLMFIVKYDAIDSYCGYKTTNI